MANRRFDSCKWHRHGPLSLRAGGLLCAEKSNLPFLPLIKFPPCSVWNELLYSRSASGRRTVAGHLFAAQLWPGQARATASVIMDKLIELLGNVIFLAIACHFQLRFPLIERNAGNGYGGTTAAILLWPPIHIALLYRGRHPLWFRARRPTCLSGKVSKKQYDRRSLLSTWQGHSSTATLAR